MANLASADTGAQLQRLEHSIDQLLAEAKRCGASAAEAVVSAGTGLEISDVELARSIRTTTTRSRFNKASL